MFSLCTIELNMLIGRRHDTIDKLFTIPQTKSSTSTDYLMLVRYVHRSHAHTACILYMHIFDENRVCLVVNWIAHSLFVGLLLMDSLNHETIFSLCVHFKLKQLNE